jgi:ATP-dependent Clp protease ATP-binding subunit ClpC
VSAEIFQQIAENEDLILCIEGFASLADRDRLIDNRRGNLFAISRLRCRVVGLISPREYDELFGNWPDAADLFNVIDVPEPDIPVATAVVMQLAAGLEQEYQVTIEPGAVRQAVTLSNTYILNERLPHKALNILHAECEDLAFERTQLGSERNRITEADVVRRVGSITDIPESTLTGVAENIDYAEGLRQFIAGQEHAVIEVGTELALIRAGLTDPGKPASVMMFIGQTGTGKTELAKAVARFYASSKTVKTYTLGNFIEPHSVSGIIGVPPGYVGHDSGGRLINELNAEPYSVFLLDEADKAHPDVMQPFLNLFDEGWIYDQRGVKACADKSIFILTTNVAQRQIGEMCREGKSIDEITARIKETLSQIRHGKSNRPVFTSEFLARIRRFIVFRSLDEEGMIGVARILDRKMTRDWQARRSRSLHISEELVCSIAKRAHAENEKVNGGEGGRLIRKLFADYVETAIQTAISNRPDEYRHCSTVEVTSDSTGDGIGTVSVRFLT